MAVTPATDISGVQYEFECTAGGGNSSGWQTGTTYEDTALTPNTTYTYRVRARDDSEPYNYGEYSVSASATTLYDPNDPDDPGEDDGLPPSPAPTIISAVWSLNAGWWRITLTATAAPPVTDNSGQVFYRFTCADEADLNSVWFALGNGENTYTKTIGPSKRNMIWFVQAQDAHGNKTTPMPVSGYYVSP